MNYLKTFFCLFTCLFFFCCRESKEAVKNTAAAADSAIIIKNHFPVSARTKMFIASLQREINSSKKGMTSFVPSQKLTDAYNLIKIKGRYFLSGFIKTDEHFTEQTFQDSGVVFGQPSNGIRTVQVPLSYFPGFLEQTGITYFEISQKLSFK